MDNIDSNNSNHHDNIINSVSLTSISDGHPILPNIISDHSNEVLINLCSILQINLFCDLN